MTHAAAHAIDKCGLSSELMATICSMMVLHHSLLRLVLLLLFVSMVGGRVRNHGFVKRWVAISAAMGSHKQCFHFCSIGCAGTSLLYSSRHSPHLHWWAWAYRAYHIGPFATVSSPLIRLSKDDATNEPYTSIVSAYPCHCSSFCQLDYCGHLCLRYSVALRASSSWSILAPMASYLIQTGH